MRETLFEYERVKYPDYIRRGNACQFVAPFALQFCQGRGLDIGAGRWPLPGAEAIELSSGHDGRALPVGEWDFIFSSHALEHIPDAVGALEHWHSRLRAGGVLFLYLPHPEMRYWNTTRNRKHLHEWRPKQMERILRDIGYVDVIGGRRDLAWSFACVGFKE